MNQQPSSHRIDPAELADVIAGVASGVESDERRLHDILASPVTAAVAGFLRSDDVEASDVVQETLVATFRYVKEGGGFEGDIVSFAVTVARNRCRNVVNRRKRRREDPVEDVQERMSDGRPDVVERILSDEALDILRDGIRRLDRICRIVLRAFYIEERTIEEIRSMTGLKTVQGVYYRRQVCIKSLAGLLHGTL